MKIQVCMGNACRDKFGEYILKRLYNDIDFYKESGHKIDLTNIIIEQSPCMGLCKTAPNVKIDKEIVNYATPLDISKNVIDKKKNIITRKNNNKKK